MSITKSIHKGFILILIGASLQNIVWFIRLQSPMMVREFEMYWADEGARLFLGFNVINYFFISILIFMYIIFLLLDRRRDVKEVDDE